MGPVTMEMKINRNSQAVLYMPTGEKLHLFHWYNCIYGFLLYS
jgi:hypothetical protein